MDDRHERGSTIVTSQVPVDHWHEVIGDPTIADAVLLGGLWSGECCCFGLESSY